MKTAENGIRKYRKEMERTLKPDRFEHSLGVAYTSAALAMRYDADVQRALIAGMLHDCAKGIDHEEQLKLCRKNNIEVSEAELKNPKLLHARTGAWLARHRYDIEDEEILGAIRWHTTGKPGMTKLEKIVFLADIIEPNRKPFPELSEIRRAILDDLEDGLKLTLGYLMTYLRAQGGVIDPMTEETCRYYGVDPDQENGESGEREPEKENPEKGGSDGEQGSDSE